MRIEHRSVLLVHGGRFYKLNGELLGVYGQRGRVFAGLLAPLYDQRCESLVCHGHEHSNESLVVQLFLANRN